MNSLNKTIEDYLLKKPYNYSLNIKEDCYSTTMLQFIPLYLHRYVDKGDNINSFLYNKFVKNSYTRRIKISELTDFLINIKQGVYIKVKNKETSNVETVIFNHCSVYDDKNRTLLTVALKNIPVSQDEIKNFLVDNSNIAIYVSTDIYKYTSLKSTINSFVEDLMKQGYIIIWVKDIDFLLYNNISYFKTSEEFFKNCIKTIST